MYISWFVNLLSYCALHPHVNSKCKTSKIPRVLFLLCTDAQTFQADDLFDIFTITPRP